MKSQEYIEWEEAVYVLNFIFTLVSAFMILSGCVLLLKGYNAAVALLVWGITGIIISLIILFDKNYLNILNNDGIE